jgi:hypothetical protein
VVNMTSSARREAKAASRRHEDIGGPAIWNRSYAPRPVRLSLIAHAEVGSG